MDFNIRAAKKSDLPQVLDLIKELALYEKSPEQVTISLADLENDGFGNNPVYWIIVAESDNKIVGMSFYYIRYSTWKGKCLYLEDLIVEEQYRGFKIGEALFRKTLEEAKKINAKLMNWQVLDWNEPALNFYKKFNAEMDDEWINGRIIIEE